MNLARLLVIAGVLLIVLGGLVYLAAKVHLPLGRLPGDFRFQWGNVTCFFPLATMIILSILLSVGLSLLARFLNK